MYDNRREIFVSEETFNDFEDERNRIGLTQNGFIIYLMGLKKEPKHKGKDSAQTIIYPPSELKPPCMDKV
jgi:hypothetical protein